MSGVVFHEKKRGFIDGYSASGNITLPSNSFMYDTTLPTFVAYAFFGCHHSNGGNFDAGIQVAGSGKYRLFINGGSVIEKKGDSTWYESPNSFSASGTHKLTVELIYVNSNKGQVKVSACGQSLSANFASGQWSGKFQNGVQFWKEMTVASSLNPFTNLWSAANKSRTQKVYMSDMTFGEVKVLRYSGGSTQYSLDSNCSPSSTPKIDGSGSLPSWSQMRYSGTPTSGSSNKFSIDCRP